MRFLSLDHVSLNGTCTVFFGVGTVLMMCVQLHILFVARVGCFPATSLGGCGGVITKCVCCNFGATLRKEKRRSVFLCPLSERSGP